MADILSSVSYNILLIGRTNLALFPFTVSLVLIFYVSVISLELFINRLQMQFFAI